MPKKKENKNKKKDEKDDEPKDPWEENRERLTKKWGLKKDPDLNVNANFKVAESPSSTPPSSSIKTVIYYGFHCNECANGNAQVIRQGWDGKDECPHCGSDNIEYTQRIPPKETEIHKTFGDGKDIEIELKIKLTSKGANKLSERILEGFGAVGALFKQIENLPDDDLQPPEGYCLKCDQMIPPDAKHCPRCGPKEKKGPKGKEENIDEETYPFRCVCGNLLADETRTLKGRVTCETCGAEYNFYKKRSSKTCLKVLKEGKMPKEAENDE